MPGNVVKCKRAAPRRVSERLRLRQAPRAPAPRTATAISGGDQGQKARQVRGTRAYAQVARPRQSYLLCQAKGDKALLPRGLQTCLYCRGTSKWLQLAGLCHWLCRPCFALAKQGESACTAGRGPSPRQGPGYGQHLKLLSRIVTSKPRKSLGKLVDLRGSVRILQHYVCAEPPAAAARMARRTAR